MLFLKGISARLRRTRRRMRGKSISGTAALEFAMVAPPFFLFLFGIIEVGVIFFAQGVIQNATDDTARMIRTGQFEGSITSSQLVDQICSETGTLISSATCKSGLQVDLRSYGGFSGASYPSVTKADGSIDSSKLTIQSAAACSVVLMRVFYPWSVMTPLMAPLLENSPGGIRLLTATAAFRNEPYGIGSC